MLSHLLANAPNATTFAGNIVVFAAAIAAAVAGTKAAVDKIKDGFVHPAKEVAESGTAVKVAGAHLLDNYTLMMWTESNKAVCEALADVKDEMRELRHELEVTRISKGSHRD